MNAVRTVRAGLGALVLAGLMLLAGPVAPTWAHAELISSNPADGATVAAAPASATLTFTDEIDAQFVRAAVTTPGGTGTVQATTDRQTVTIPITSAGPGAYSIVYRVVSADGHPISGQLAFTVAGTPTGSPASSASPPSASASASASAAPGGAAVTASGPAAAVPGSDASADPGSSWLLWGALGLAVVAGVGAVLFAVRGRRS